MFCPVLTPPISSPSPYSVNFMFSSSLSHSPYLSKNENQNRQIDKKKSINQKIPKTTHTHTQRHEVHCVIANYSWAWACFGEWLIYPVTLH